MGRRPKDEKLPPLTKAVFAFGDHTLGLTLSALTLFYLPYLTNVVGLRPVLASAVLLVGRFVDAFTDPLMGRISDRTKWRLGRRRPYFLIGAVPFGLSFAALWIDYPVESQWLKFTIYCTAYILYSLASTVLSIPYVAIVPELTLDYNERTSLSTYRAVGSGLATLLAAGAMRPIAEAYGGGAFGYAMAGLYGALWITWPWFAIHRVTFERPEYHRESAVGIVAGMRALYRHLSFRRLTGLYIMARIALDIVGAMFLYFFTYWIRRPQDFELTMLVLFVAVIASLPVWLRIARRRDKSSVFVAGACWWISVQLAMFFTGPDVPRFALMFLIVCAGIGYAVVDMMPFAMLADVVDEDELLSGERREGLYAGVFTFLRKLGGASGVFLAGAILDVAGFTKGDAQPASAVEAIRIVTALVPAGFLAVAAWIARSYPISREAHAEILAAIQRRRQLDADF